MSYAEDIRKQLQDRVIGQDNAIGQVVDAVVRWKAGLAGIDKPVGALMLAGRTGCGKTRLAEALAEILHKDRKLMIKIHCAEYRHSHEIARLTGAPPGYIGHKETQPRLSPRRLQEAQTKENPLVIVLIDEVEKAHEDLWNLFLGILDKGECHLGDGSTADLRNSLIFFTSNAGEKQAAKTSGFVDHEDQSVLSVINETFSPEFRNRLTAIIRCNDLTDDHLRQIAELELFQSANRVGMSKGVILSFAKGCTSLVLDGDRRFGARPIRRAIEQRLELPLAHKILDGSIGAGEHIEVSVSNGKYAFRNINLSKKAGI